MNQQLPIHRLFCQPDVLTPIFRLLVEERLTLPPPPLHPQLVLSRVSRIWRGVMITIPAFWDTFTLKAAWFRNPDERIDVVKTFIRRGGAGPLWLTFQTNLSPEESVVGASLRDLLFGAGEVSIVNEFIIPNVERIVELKCLLYGTEISRFLLNISPGAFRSLMVLDITFLNTYIDNWSHYIAPTCYNFRPFDGIPHLHRVSCDIIDSHINPLDLRLPLRRLTTLHFKTVIMPPDAFIRIIRSCSLSLINASFSVELDSRWVARQPKYIASIVMPSLTELDLRLIDLSWDPLFPLVLQLPVLQKFFIGEADRNFPLKWNLHVYGALALRSARTLKTLRLVDLEINPETKLPVNVIPGTYHHRSTPARLSSHSELEEFLRAFPFIKNLALPLSVYIHYTTLEKIAMGTLLPVLETLEVGTGTYTDASAVLAMVRKRKPAQSSSTSPWVSSPFSFLTLILPTTTAEIQAQVTQAANSLDLESGCHLWFIPRCKSWKDQDKQDICGRHCFFSHTR